MKMWGEIIAGMLMGAAYPIPRLSGGNGFTIPFVADVAAGFTVCLAINAIRLTSRKTSDGYAADIANSRTADDHVGTVLNSSECN
jgi:hypothetical protein